MIKVTGMIHYKGGVRISILCGRKAVLDYRRRVQQDGKISSLLSAKENQLSEAVERLKEENAGLQGRLAQLRREYFSDENGKPAEEKRTFGSGSGWTGPGGAASAGYYAVSSGTGGYGSGDFRERTDRKLFLCNRSEKQDVRPLGKELNRLLNGRGGGSAQMVQGTFGKTRKKLLKDFCRRRRKCVRNKTDRTGLRKET